MKIINIYVFIFIFIAIVSYFSPTMGMESKCRQAIIEAAKSVAGNSQKQLVHIQYRQATQSDVKTLVDLVNTHAHKESDKIVIVPEQFRAAYFESAIKSGRLFIALCGEVIVGYKKLFCITDKTELDEILTNELRFYEKPVASGTISIADFGKQKTVVKDSNALLISSSKIYIYNGADFTHPDYRSKGVNAYLTQYALNSVIKTVIEQSKAEQAVHVALVYGLTQANAGKEHELLGGRTSGLVKQFIPFIKSVAEVGTFVVPATLILSRYRAFKPSFDPKSQECRPLSDDKAVPGYGCSIACNLSKKGNA